MYISIFSANLSATIFILRKTEQGIIIYVHRSCWDSSLESCRGLVCVCVCVVRWKSVRRADPSSGVVLPNVVCRCVRLENLKNEEAMARVGL